MNTTAQLTMAIAITLGTIAAFQSAKIEQELLASIIAFGSMRLVQPLFNYMESLIGRSSKMGNIICFIFFLLVTIGMQAIIAVSLYQPYQNPEVSKLMQLAAYDGALIVELGVWDTIMMPILMSLIGTCACGKKFFTALTLRVPPCGK